MNDKRQYLSPKDSDDNIVRNQSSLKECLDVPDESEQLLIEMDLNNFHHQLKEQTNQLLSNLAELGGGSSSPKADSLMYNVRINHKESCNMAAQDEGHPVIHNMIERNGSYNTVGDLLKVYEKQMMPLEEGEMRNEGGGPRKNPLVKNKGRIRHDWTTNSQKHENISNIGSSNMIGSHQMMPFSNLNKDYQYQNKTLVQNLNYSSFNSGSQFKQKNSSSGLEEGGGSLSNKPPSAYQMHSNYECSNTANGFMQSNASNKVSSDTVAFGEKSQNATTTYKDSNGRLHQVLSSNNVNGVLKGSQVAPKLGSGVEPTVSRGFSSNQQVARSSTPQLRQRKMTPQPSGFGVLRIGVNRDGVFQLEQPVSKLSNFIQQLYNKMIPSDKNSSSQEEVIKDDKGSSDEAVSHSLDPSFAQNNAADTKQIETNNLGYKVNDNNPLTNSKIANQYQLGQRTVRIEENASSCTPSEEEDECEDYFDTPDEKNNLPLKNPKQTLRYSNTDKVIKNRRKTSHVKQNEMGSIVLKKDQLVKIQTQKEMLLYEENKEDEGGDLGKEKQLAGSKSYVYLAKGLSGELSDSSSCQGVNYRSAFFENDKDLEIYNKQLKDALMVQFQKEINIGSHHEVKWQYDQWVQINKDLFQKKSPFKKTLVFDLDETLVRVQREEPEMAYDTRINVIDQASQTSSFIYVKLRPYLIKTLTILKQHYELILFTAASEQYADIVLASFEGHQYFDHILSRRHCLHIFQKAVFIKDLQILLGNRILNDIIIVDNKIESYSSNLENGIPIISYYGEEGDIMLRKLYKYLLKLKDTDDVRETILKDFYLQDLASMQRSNNDQNRIFDTNEIKACILKAREKQKYQSLQNAQDVLINSEAPATPSNKPHLNSYRDEEELDLEDEMDEHGVVGRSYSRRFGDLVREETVQQVSKFKKATAIERPEPEFESEDDEGMEEEDLNFVGLANQGGYYTFTKQPDPVQVQKEEEKVPEQQLPENNNLHEPIS